MTTVQTRNFPGVEFARAGTWSSRNGKATITREDLEDAVKAYQDPEVDHGKLKFGHVSNLNDGLGDGAPSYGWLENLRLSGDGNALIGDIVDVPAKVAGLIGRAYRQRSVEMRRNVTTPSGKIYKTALTGLALLGAAPPAVKGMEDILALYASENPNGIDDDATQTEILSIEMSDINADTAEIHHQSPEPGQSGDQNPAERGEPDLKETPTMAFLDEARTALGLPEGATEDEILTALKNKPAVETETPAEEEAPKASAETEVEAPVEQAKAEEKVEASAETPKVVTLSASVYEQEQAELAQLRADRAARERNETIKVALSEGRITPAEKDHWVTALSANPEAIGTLLKSLPSRVNVTESGSSVALSATTETDEADLAARAAALGI